MRCEKYHPIYAPDPSYPDEHHQGFRDLLQLNNSRFGDISTQKWVTTSILPGQNVLESLDWAVRMIQENNCCSPWPTQVFNILVLGKRNKFHQVEEP